MNKKGEKTKKRIKDINKKGEKTKKGIKDINKKGEKTKNIKYIKKIKNK